MYSGAGVRGASLQIIPVDATATNTSNTNNTSTTSKTVKTSKTCRTSTSSKTCDAHIPRQAVTTHVGIRAGITYNHCGAMQDIPKHVHQF